MKEHAMPENVSLSKDDLKEILKANSEALIEAVRELKKPTPEEQKKLDAAAKEVELAQANRRALSKDIIADKEAKRNFQKNLCSHEHKNGDSHCTWVQEKSGPGYIICQKCQGKIRAGSPPKDRNYDKDDIYDTALFNKVWQKVGVNEVFA